MKLSIKLKSSDCKTKEANVSQGLLQYIAMLQKELELYVPMLVKILTQKEKKVWKRASIKGKKKYNLCKRISQSIKNVCPITEKNV